MKTSLRLAAATIATAALLGACGDDEPTQPGVTTSAPTPNATVTLPGASTDEVKETSELFGQLVDVRVGEHEGFDRVVLEFEDDVPGYSIKYVDLPVIEDGSGDSVELPGADFAVHIVMTPASAWNMEAGEPTYTGPKVVTNDKTAEITSAVDSGDFEAVLSWAVGLRHEVPFKVTTLSNPARLVVDFQTG